MSTQHQLWNRFDNDGSGNIDKAELGRMYREAGVTLTPEQLDRQWARFDADGDGSVSRQEFMRHVHSTGQKIGYRFRSEANHVEHLFKQFDSNRDGHLDRHELENFYRSVGANLDHHELDTQMKYLGAGHRGVDINGFRKIVRVRTHGHHSSHHHHH